MERSLSKKYEMVKPANTQAKQSADESQRDEAKLSLTFDPAPRFTQQWWLDHRRTDAIPLPLELERPGIVNEQSWVITATFGTKTWGHRRDWWPLFFPTATDAILWLRLHVFADAEDYPQVAQLASMIAQMIDEAAPNTSAVDLLRELTPMLFQAFVQAEIVAVASIHEWLSGEGDEDELRDLFRTEAIVCDNGHWTMPQEVWDMIFPEVVEHECTSLGLRNE